MLDAVDKKALQSVIENTDRLPVIVQAQLLEVLDNAVDL
jgi:hypothetical protein